MNEITKSTAALKQVLQLCSRLLIANLVPLGRNWWPRYDRFCAHEGELETEQKDEVPARISWQGRDYRRNHLTHKSIDTGFGQINLRRWFCQNSEPTAPGIAPLDLRLGLFWGRMPSGWQPRYRSRWFGEPCVR